MRSRAVKALLHGFHLAVRRGSSQRLSAGGDALGHRIVDAAADLRSRNAVQLVGGNDVQHGERHVRVAAEHSLQDGRGVGQDTDLSLIHI